MSLIVKDTAELPQVFLICIISFLTLELFLSGIGLISDYLESSIWLFLIFLLLDILAIFYYIQLRKKLLSIVRERKELDKDKNLPDLTSKTLWSNIGMIYLLRLGWIPIAFAVYGILYLFMGSNNPIIPLLIAFAIFVIFAIFSVRYLEKKK